MTLNCPGTCSPPHSPTLSYSSHSHFHHFTSHISTQPIHEQGHRSPHFNSTKFTQHTYYQLPYVTSGLTTLIPTCRVIEPAVDTTTTTIDIMTCDSRHRRRCQQPQPHYDHNATIYLATIPLYHHKSPGPGDGRSDVKGIPLSITPHHLVHDLVDLHPHLQLHLHLHHTHIHPATTTVYQITFTEVYTMECDLTDS
eukprot:2780831-Amphidinium_carterae.1